MSFVDYELGKKLSAYGRKNLKNKPFTLKTVIINGEEIEIKVYEEQDRTRTARIKSPKTRTTKGKMK